MLKRIFWLVLIGLGGWLLWNIWRQRQVSDHTTTPQFAPIVPTPPAPSTTPAPTAPPAQPPARTDTNGTSAPAAPAKAAVDSPTSTDEPDPIIGYCTRCKEKRQISNAHEERTENGRRAARGTCPVCGGNMYTFLKNEPDDE